VTIETDIDAAGVIVITVGVKLANCIVEVNAAELLTDIESCAIFVIAVVIILAAAIDQLPGGEVDIVNAFIVEAFIDGTLVHVLTLSGASAGAPRNRRIDGVDAGTMDAQVGSTGFGIIALQIIVATVGDGFKGTLRIDTCFGRTNVQVIAVRGGVAAEWVWPLAKALAKLTA